MCSLWLVGARQITFALLPRTLWVGAGLRPAPKAGTVSFNATILPALGEIADVKRSMSHARAIGSPLLTAPPFTTVAKIPFSGIMHSPTLL